MDIRSLLDAAVAEDQFAPDIFCAQLLGPGYDGRVPAVDGWRRAAAGADAIVLEHCNPGAWFDGEPDAATLAQARTDFRPILFEPKRGPSAP